jgi:hypothetical protein
MAVDASQLLSADFKQPDEVYRYVNFTVPGDIYRATLATIVLENPQDFVIMLRPHFELQFTLDFDTGAPVANNWLSNAVIVPDIFRTSGSYKSILYATYSKVLECSQHGSQPNWVTTTVYIDDTFSYDVIYLQPGETITLGFWVEFVSHDSTSALRAFDPTTMTYADRVVDGSTGYVAYREAGGANVVSMTTTY